MYRRFTLLCIVSGRLIHSASALSTALVATPTEKDTLGISAALIFFTLIQFLIAGTYIFRFKKNHLLPGLTTIFALLVTLIYFTLNTLYLLSLHVVNTDDIFQPQVFSDDAISALFFSSGYFSDWTDPFTLLAIVLVIRDRYATYFRTRVTSTSSEKPARSFPFHVFMAIFIFLAFANFIFGTASISLFGEANAGGIDVQDFINKNKQGNNLLFVQQTFNSLMILLLIPFTLMVRRCMPKDKILNYVLFGIIPILFLRFIGGIVLLTYLNKPLSFNAADALPLAFLVVPGFTYFFVFSILCYLLLRVDFWLAPGEEMTHAVQYAQFPGQWGHFQPPIIQPQPPYPVGNAQWVQQSRTVPMV